MFEGTDDKAGIDEQYAVASGSSNLRVGNDHTIRTPGDMIAAAGMNKHRMGLALNRLVSEWNSGATPLHKEGDGISRAEAKRQAAQMTRWEEQENMLRFLHLKTLPAVRAGLLRYVQAKDWEEGEHLVASIVQRFLSPVCPECEGRKQRVVPGTGRLGRKLCGACKGTGEAKVGYGGKGYRLLEYINSCTRSAAADLRNGAYREHRGEKNQGQREGIDQREARDRDIAVSAEKEREPDAQRRAAIAAHFALGKRKLKP